MTYRYIRLFLIVFLSTFIVRIGFSQNDTILLDIGNILSPPTWNNLIGAANGQVSNLINSQGHPTGISVVVSDAFNGTNTAGTSSPDSALGFPASATEDSFFGNVVVFSNKIEPTGALLFSNLNTQKKYAFEIFASRMASDNRETRYILSGLTQDTLYLNPSSNASLTVKDSLFPAADGTIILLAEPGPANNNNYGFFYLGAVKITYAHEPLTGPASLNVLSPAGGEFWQVGKTPAIIWESTNVGQVYLSYSLNSGSTWHAIDTVHAYLKEYPWIIPHSPSANCLVRVATDTLSAASSSVFEIAADTISCPIVVLGSSTAYGAGASPIDSSWVGLFHKYMFQKNTRFSVINLARGGYTTYHILPTGTSVPPGVTIQIDTVRNMTKALSYNPTAIIINMPSNDAANNFGVSQQMDNLTLLNNVAQNLGIAVWISTTQPRNFNNPAQIQIQYDVRDAILNQFGLFAIDFWNGVADTNGFILNAYDVGDGIHLNNAGHRLLFERVFIKTPDTLSCGQSIVTPLPDDSRGFEPIIYPNPASDRIYITLTQKVTPAVVFSFYHVSGQTVFSYKLHEAINEIDVSSLVQGAYLYTLTRNGEALSSGVQLIAR